MDHISEMLRRLVPEMVDIFRQSSVRIILYGSVARGMQAKDSDVDIAVILTSYTEEEYDRMWDLIVDLQLEYDLVLSVLLIDAQKFAEWENVMPFYINMKKDGVILWPAA